MKPESMMDVCFVLKKPIKLLRLFKEKFIRMKEYLLLRNNKQSGPYSVGELQSMGLKSLDLIWVDKKSCSWRYPSEISELASFVPPIEDLTTAVPKQESKVINIAEDYASEKVTEWSKTRVAVKKSDSEFDERHNNHIVTLSPRVNQPRVKTIKSIGQPRIINVKLRENEIPKESPVWQHTSSLTTATTSNTGYLPDENREINVNKTNVLPASDPSNNFFSIIKSLPGDTDNKLELMVLTIGAISLLAIAYLLITSPY